MLDLRVIQSNMVTKPNNTGLSQNLSYQGWTWPRKELREEMGEDPWVEWQFQGRLLREVARHVQRGGGGGAGSGEQCLKKAVLPGRGN